MEGYAPQKVFLSTISRKMNKIGPLPPGLRDGNQVLAEKSEEGLHLDNSSFTSGKFSVPVLRLIYNHSGWQSNVTTP
jgi:hypothetical protein